MSDFPICYQSKSGSGYISDLSFWCQSRSGSYPKLSTGWKITNDFYSQQCQLTMFYLSLHRQRCHIFVYSWDSLFKLPGKSIVQLYVWLKQIIIRMGRHWMAFRISQNDADPVGSWIDDTSCRVRVPDQLIHTYSSTGTVPLYRRREREPPGLLASSPPQCKTSSLFWPRTSQENSFVLLFLSSYLSA
jgi:hypothetical protein